MTPESVAGKSALHELVPGVCSSIYSLREFERIAQLVRRESGIVLGERKILPVYTQLAALMRESGHHTFRQYLNTLADDATERDKVISALSTNHTYFNRETHHFEHFKRDVRDDLITRAQRGTDVHIWSAGVSSGEEIWTLLMFLLGENRSQGKRIARSNIRAFASDLSSRMIDRALAALYPADELKAIPETLRANWSCPIIRDGEDYRLIANELRNMVQFEALNLLAPWSFDHLFDVIFCRNVLIYFDQPSREQVLLSLAKQMRVGATLYLGHSECLCGEAADLLEPIGATIFRRKDA